MRLLLKDYLKEVKERDELERLLPDLLAEMGFHVFSSPSRGPRQYGVDVGAVGRKEGDKTDRLYLFVIKCGNITRAEWSKESQGVHDSLQECFEVYIPKFLPVEYRALPITVCICCGGEIVQQAAPNVDAYKELATRQYRCRMETWNGDLLAKYLETYFCNTQFRV